MYIYIYIHICIYTHTAAVTFLDQRAAPPPVGPVAVLAKSARLSSG